MRYRVKCVEANAHWHVLMAERVRIELNWWQQHSETENTHEIIDLSQRHHRRHCTHTSHIVQKLLLEFYVIANRVCRLGCSCHIIFWGMLSEWSSWRCQMIIKLFSTTLDAQFSKANMMANTFCSDISCVSHSEKNICMYENIWIGMFWHGFFERLLRWTRNLI